MRSLIIAATALTLTLSGSPTSACRAELIEEAETAPVANIGEVEASARVEVVFVLDTTGSMSGLIEGAKQKIWWIANQILRGSPTPDLEIGLVAYRDVGDTYVTQVFDLEGDLDRVYQSLMSFTADGGGDGPEHVNQALHDAVHEMTWSEDDETLKIVFLVGDAPPHMDYQDGHDYRNACLDAITHDIVINTIQCGTYPETLTFWTDIARLGEGEYSAVEQSGGMRVIATPLDEELAELSRKLDGTRVFWGDADVRGERMASVAGMADLAAPVAAERAAFKSRSRRVDSGDLVEAVRAGAVDLDELDRDLLPEDLRSLSPEELRAELEARSAERAAIEKELVDLNQKRDAYVQAKLEASGEADSFDGKVLETIQKQAARKGITYPDESGTHS